MIIQYTRVRQAFDPDLQLKFQVPMSLKTGIIKYFSKWLHDFFGNSILFISIKDCVNNFSGKSKKEKKLGKIS